MRTAVIYYGFTGLLLSAAISAPTFAAPRCHFEVFQAGETLTKDFEATSGLLHSEWLGDFEARVSERDGNLTVTLKPETGDHPKAQVSPARGVQVVLDAGSNYRAKIICQ